jgi:hypothetical protein
LLRIFYTISNPFLFFYQLLLIGKIFVEIKLKKITLNRGWTFLFNFSLVVKIIIFLDKYPIKNFNGSVFFKLYYEQMKPRFPIKFEYIIMRIFVFYYNMIEKWQNLNYMEFFF